MSLLRRIRGPFGEYHDDNSQEPQRRSHAVGQLLRDRREELGWELEEIGEALRIRPSFLAALEQGRPQDLPGPTYAIGFVRAYAGFLGFDADHVLDTYKAESVDVHLRPDLSLPVPLPPRSLPGGPILLVGVILALCGYGTWYYLSTGDRDRPERVSVVPSELQQELRGGTTAKPAPSGTAQRPGSALLAPPDALLSSAPAGPAPGATSASAPAPDPAPAAPSAAAAPASTTPTRPNTAVGRQAALPNATQPNTPPAGPATVPLAPAAPTPGMSASAAPVPAAPGAAPPAAAAGTVDIRAVADCWIQVRAADNQSIVFSRVLKAGETYHVPRPGLFLRTGNAGALTIVVDGKTVPAIGELGALRRNVSLDPTALTAGTAVKG